MASLVVRSAGSGEVLAELDGDDFQRMVEAHGSTVKALKLELKDQGFGCRFRQRLLNDSVEMQDDEILVPPLDLKLLRLNLCPFDKGDTQALLEASKEGRLEEVETRLKKLQDPNAANMKGRTALTFAAKHGHLECVRLLLEAGASCEVATYGKVTPLHRAVANGHLEVVRLMLEYGASCEMASHSGITPLHRAVTMNHVEVVRLLLEAGASCEAGTSAGMTPLHCAVAKGNVEVVRLLLEAGASCDPCITNCLLQLAVDRGHDEIVQLLEAGVQRKKRRKVTAR